MINIGLEKEFVSRVGQELDLFKWKSEKVSVCRCPYCGDSKKKKTKVRGYFYVHPDKNSFFYKCHNCGVAVSLYDFLDFKNPSLHNEMKMEYIKQKRFEESYDKPQPKKKINVKPETVPYKPDPMMEYPTIFELDTNHPARVYAEKIRLLPKDSLMRIYYAEDFPELACNLDNSKEEKDLGPKIPRIIFPLYDRNKNLFGVSGRCIGSDSDLRYITIREGDSNHIKVYGLDRFDPDKKSYCVEGALDSEFLPNCVALAGAGSLKKSSLPFSTENMTMIFDNEPRNKDIVRFMSQCLNNGFTVCIWGKDFKYKDINEAIQNGMTQKEIIDHIEKNSFFGLMGTLKLGSWKV